MGRGAGIGFGLGEDGFGVRIACCDFKPGAVFVGVRFQVDEVLGL